MHLEDRDSEAETATTEYEVGYSSLACDVVTACTQAHPKCLSHLTVKFAKMYLALEKLSEDCGLTGRTLFYA
jgi:hypothetical protein